MVHDSWFVFVRFWVTTPGVVQVSNVRKEWLYLLGVPHTNSFIFHLTISSSTTNGHPSITVLIQYSPREVPRPKDKEPDPWPMWPNKWNFNYLVVWPLYVCESFNSIQIVYKVFYLWSTSPYRVRWHLPRSFITHTSSTFISVFGLGSTFSEYTTLCLKLEIGFSILWDTSIRLTHYLDSPQNSHTGDRKTRT